MKKAEAISILATSVRPREAKDRARYDEAVRMAIEALKCSETPKSSERTSETAQPEKQLATDTISRRAAIDAICNACGKIDCDKMDKCEKLQLPPANCSEFPNNSDTISRRAAIDMLDEQIELCNKALCSFYISPKDEYAIKVERASLKAYKEQLENMPSAQPECKPGRWIKEENRGQLYRCSACGNFLDFRGVNAGRGNANYCPNCGADMRGGEME